MEILRPYRALSAPAHLPLTQTVSALKLRKDKQLTTEFCHRKRLDREEYCVDKSKRRMIEGWIDKAENQLKTAKDHLKSHYWCSESIEASQECVELSVKSVLSLLEIEYSLSHGWNKEEFSRIAKQIQEKQLLDRLKAQNLYHSSRLPRLLLIANFWAQFYLPAKYGFETGNLAPAQDLFTVQEAELAAQHAEECYRAASELRYLGEDKLAVVVRT